MSESQNPDFPVGSALKVAGVGIIVLMLVFAATGVFYTIDSGERGVVTRNGDVQNSVGAGLHFKIPFIDDVTRYDVRSTAYTMSSKQGEGNNAMRDDSIDALSSEGMELNIDSTIRFHLEPSSVENTYTSVGVDKASVVDKIVRPTTRAAFRSCASKYKGLQIYSTQRDAFETCVTENIEGQFKDYGVTLEAVQIRSVNLPKSVVESINEKQASEKRLEKKQVEINIAKKNKEKAKIEAQAEAERIRIKGEALRDNPQVLQLRYIEALKNGNTIYVPSDGSMTLTKELEDGNTTNTTATNSTSTND